jgi:hypothetical protein
MAGEHMQPVLRMGQQRRLLPAEVLLQLGPEHRADMAGQGRLAGACS